MECMKIHPLDIPEILASVGLFMGPDSLVTCIRVSKLWYRVLLPWIWWTTKVRLVRYGKQTLSLIPKHATFIRELIIDHESALKLSNSTTTLPILANLDVGETLWRTQLDDPALAVLIERHRETLKSVSLDQHACNAIMEALADCPRLESLPSVIQDDRIEWIAQFERLWSRLHRVSLKDTHHPSLDRWTSVTTTARKWPRFNGPNRIQDLSLSFIQPEVIPGFSTWIVKQCPDLVRIEWVHIVVNYRKSPMEQLVAIFKVTQRLVKSWRTSR